MTTKENVYERHQKRCNRKQVLQQQSIDIEPLTLAHLQASNAKGYSYTKDLQPSQCHSHKNYCVCRTQFDRAEGETSISCLELPSA